MTGVIAWRKTRAWLAGLLVLAAVPAHAHQGDPNVFTRIGSITPAMPGVTVQVRAGVADQLLVVNTTPTPVWVLGGDGKPFLRIASRDVLADRNNPEFYASSSPFGTGSPPRLGDKPDWVPVARTGSFGWFDHRLHDRAFSPPRSTRGNTRLAEWTVPLRYGSTDVAVKGYVEYRPIRGAFRTKVEKVPPGVTADALDGRVPGLFLRWEGSGTLLVSGIEGEAFARLSKDGVQVNEASTTWQDDQRLRGAPTAITPADPTQVV